MTTTLQQCRQHYEGLSPHIKDRKTAQCLLSAIQIAEQNEILLLSLAEAAHAFRDRVATEGVELHRLDAVLKKVAKPEGK